MTKFKVENNIKIAETLPSEFYKSNKCFNDLRDKVFYRSWQLIEHESILPVNTNVYPFDFMKDYIDEPLILLKDENDEYKCLTNVCTHRANIIVNDRCKVNDLRCMYHGRKFHLDGKFKSMPEFDDAKNFPRECDNLKEFQVRSMGPFLFVGLEPSYEINTVFSQITERVSFIPLDKLTYRGDLSKDYLVNSHWALYCDNYLEGFHIPFVHPKLNGVLDFENYDVEIFKYSNLQIGIATNNDICFELPEQSKDFGKKIAAYYFWLFPNLMLNFYPWGLSINIITPISVNKTKVEFKSYVWKESKLNSGAGADLDKVEIEDEEVVQKVQKGLSSRFYTSGRFSPNMETGVHHFHTLISNFMNR